MKPRQWFEIPLSCLEVRDTAVYFSKLRPWHNFERNDDDFAPLTQVEFGFLTQITDALREHIQIARSENRTPFMFMGLPHILYKGSLSLDGIEIIEY